MTAGTRQQYTATLVLRVAGVNNVRIGCVRIRNHVITRELGLAYYISGRTYKNRCRVASFPLYKKGGQSPFFYYYLFSKHEDEIGGECDLFLRLLKKTTVKNLPGQQ